MASSNLWFRHGSYLKGYKRIPKALNRRVSLILLCLHSSSTLNQFSFVCFIHIVSNRVNLAIRLKVVLLQIHIKPTFADAFDGNSLSNLNHSLMTQPFCNSSDKQSRGSSNNIENYMSLVFSCMWNQVIELIWLICSSTSSVQTQLFLQKARLQYLSCRLLSCLLSVAAVLNTPL